MTHDFPGFRKKIFASLYKIFGLFLSHFLSQGEKNGRLNGKVLIAFKRFSLINLKKTSLNY